jgi:hypothetical protein
VISLKDLVGGGWASFLVLTILVFGFAAAMTGRALASNWRSPWQVFAYAVLLAAADRFLLYALFGGVLLSAGGFILAALILFAIAIAAYRLIQVRRMVTQYPWLFERAGPFGWRDRTTRGRDS